MARKTGKKEGDTQSATTLQTGSKFEEFAEDLGRILGTARVKAEGWLGQRDAILKQLIGLRDTANGLIQQLGGGAPSPFGVRRRRKPGRPAGSGAVARKAKGGKKRTISPEARERIAAAQRARWAKQRKATAKA